MVVRGRQYEALETTEAARESGLETDVVVMRGRQYQGLLAAGAASDTGLEADVVVVRGRQHQALPSTRVGMIAEANSP